MKTILLALLMIGLVIGFFKAELGLIGLLILSVVIWNFIGSIIESYGHKW